MDTPFNKQGPRRRLKKIMKKSKVNLQASTQQLYQRKLKSAINVSLNSTRSVRSLQANNRSLASSLEKMRQDFRQVHDHYTQLLEKNHELRERILELERLVETTTSLIEEEVNKRVEKRMNHMREKLGALNTHTSGFLEALMELSEICSSRNSSSSSECVSSECQKPSSVVQRTSSPGFMRLRALDIPPPECESSADVMFSSGLSEDEVPSAEEPGAMHEMSLIMEQSVVYPSSETMATSDKTVLDSVSESDSVTTVSSDRQKTTKLPLRVPRASREPRKHSSQQMTEAMTRFNTKMNMETAKKLLRRETFTITSDQAVDTELISDIVMPQFLLSGQVGDGSGEPSSDAETLSSDYQPVRTLPSPSTGQQSQKCSGQTSMASHLRENFPKERTSKKPSVSSQAKGNPSQNRKTTKSKVSAKTLGGKRLEANNSCRKQTLCIANEFKLMNTHHQLMDKLGSVTTDANSDSLAMLYEFKPGEEHTIHPADDMELTLSSELESFSPASAQPSLKPPTLTDSSEDLDFAGSAPARARTRSRSKTRLQTGGTGDQVTDNMSEENMPDAITMRCAKPGKLVFVASRKESDGTRKNVPNIAPRARSKSKKQIAEMIENLSQTEPQSIFDFHDKTPTTLNSEKQKALSVFSISADDSTLSPLVPLPRRRSLSRYSKKNLDSAATDASTNEVSQDSIPLVEKEGKGSLLGEGATYEQALKGSPAESRVKYRTRSQSRSRRRKSCSVEKNKERTHSEGPVRNKGKQGSRAVSPEKDRAASPVGSPSPVHRSRGRSKSRMLAASVSGSGKRSFVVAADNGDGEVTKVGEKEENTQDKLQMGGTDCAGGSPARSEGNVDSVPQNRSPGVGCDVPCTESGHTPSRTTRKTRAIADVTNLPPKKGSSLNREQGGKGEESGKIQEHFSKFGSPPVPALQRKLNEMAKQKETGSVASKQGEQLSKRKKNGEKEGVSSHLESDSQTKVQSSVKPGEAGGKQRPASVRDGSSTGFTGDKVTLASDGVESLSMHTAKTSQSDRQTQSLQEVPKSHESTENICSIKLDTHSSKKSKSQDNFHRDADLVKMRKGKRSGKQNSKSTGNNKETNLPANGGPEAAETHISCTDLSFSQLETNGGCADSSGAPEPKMKDEGSPKELKGKKYSVKCIKGQEAEKDSFEEESNQALQNLKHLKTPALAQEDGDMSHGHGANNRVIEQSQPPQKTSPGPKISRIVKKPSIVSSKSLNRPATPQSAKKRPASPSSHDSLLAPEGKRRRAASKVNYAELPLNTKLRRGDPFTSHYCSSDKVDIFKSPKSKARKKADLRRDILGPLHNLAIREEVAHKSEGKSAIET